MDLKVPITIAFETTEDVIDARALLNLASGDIEGLAFDGMTFDGRAASLGQGDVVVADQAAPGDALVGHEPVQLGG